MRDDLRDIGLTVQGGRMFWGYQHGALRWTPYWVRNALIHAWNRVACKVLGHWGLGQEFSDGHCVYCCREIE